MVMLEHGRPPTVVLVGVEESGSVMLATALEAVGIDVDIDADHVTDPLLDAPPECTVVLVADRSPGSVVRLLSERRSIAPAVAAATWKAHLDRVGAIRRRFTTIEIDVDELVADPDQVVAGLVHNLRQIGIDAGGTGRIPAADGLATLLPQPVEQPAATTTVVHPAAIHRAPSPAAEGAWVTPTARRYAVIVLANVRWDFRQQRPHHLARVHGHHGHRVVYCSLDDPPAGHEQEVAPGVTEVRFAPTVPYDRYGTVAGDAIVEEWAATMRDVVGRHGIDEAVVHVQLPSWAPFAWRLRDEFGWKIVYDCMDEWDGFPGIGTDLIRAERDLVLHADLVVCTAERLRSKWVAVQPRTILVRNAVDAMFFAEHCVPSDVLSEVAHPIIGFTGGLAEWVDFRLLAEVARSHPEWNFVLIGDVFVHPTALHGLDHLPNVIFTGLRPYPAMPHHLFWFDVAIIPFVVDEISAAVDPVKFYEYCASGTPIVTTRLPELDEHRHLFDEADDAATFAEAIRRALRNGSERSADRIALARTNTWEARYQTLDRATSALFTSLSVVVVTFGRLDLTRRCLESLLAHTDQPRFEVIVVDNASTDGTPAYLRHLAGSDDRVRVVLNPTNLGFAAANNQGIDTSTGDVVILLNNDTEVHPGWTRPLMRHLDDPTIGMVGPRTDNVGNEAKIEVPEHLRADLGAFARHLARSNAGERFEIRMLAMFCVAMRRAVIDAVGPLDEGYGIGLFEDDDYAERVREAGWRVVCARDAFVHHVGQGSFRRLIEEGSYDALWRRNQARFEQRWGRWRAQSSTGTR